MQEDVRIDASGNIIDFLKSMNSEFAKSRKSSEEFQSTATGQIANLNKTVSSFSLTNVHTQIQNVNEGLQDLNGPGIGFNASLQDLSALTNITGNDLDKLGKKARESAKEFGGTAAGSIESYKMILGRLGPDIAKTQPALVGMERNVRILSKTMGGDMAGATDALTTGMLQFGVDLSDPMSATREMTKMMDVMANSAQQGAAEVPQIAAALKVSGVAAKQAKVSFVETNAAIQALAQGGKEGSEAGVALRNVLGKMAGEDVLPKEAAEKLRALGVDMNIVSDTSIPFTDRLRELKKAQGDATIMAQMFGTENASAASILLDSVDAQDKLAKVITKAGGAEAQAALIKESMADKLARVNARIEDAKIAFFEATGGMTAYLGPATEVMRTVSAFAPVYSLAKSAILSVATATGRAALAEKAKTVSAVAGAVATKAITAAQWLWNAAMSANPIGIIIVGVAALTAAVYGATKALNQQSAAEKMAADVKQRSLDKTIDERVELEKLFTRLREAKKGTDEYASALKDLDAKYPGMIEKYNLHEGKLKDINRAERELTASIIRRGEAEALGEVMKEKMTERVKLTQRDLTASENIARLSNGWSVEEYKKRESNRLKKEEKAIADVLRGYEKQPPAPAGAEMTTPTTGNADPIVSPKGYSKGSSSSSEQQGSGQVKNISVRIDKFGGDITIMAQNVKEGAAEIRRIIREELMGSIRDFEVSI